MTMFFPQHGHAVASSGTTQESDRLEKMTPKYAHELEGTNTEHVRLVSLGCMCGTKLSFQQLGRGAETLPFDWIRSRLKGILHFMRTDFEEFFRYDTMKPNACGGMHMYRSPYHSFWHDDPTDAGMQERYTRRIRRFGEIRTSADEPVLFVRAVASTDELRHASALLAELRQRFGEGAKLLLILDYQKKLNGPAVLPGLEDSLLLYYHKDEDRRPEFAPYLKPVKVGLQWAAGEDVSPERIGDFQEAQALANPTAWGYTISQGLRAFEEPGAARPLAPQLPPGMLPAVDFIAHGPPQLAPASMAFPGFQFLPVPWHATAAAGYAAAPGGVPLPPQVVVGMRGGA